LGFANYLLNVPGLPRDQETGISRHTLWSVLGCYTLWFLLTGVSSCEWRSL